MKVLVETIVYRTLNALVKYIHQAIGRTLSYFDAVVVLYFIPILAFDALHFDLDVALNASV